MSTIKYNEAQFNKAVEIINSLPPTGTIQLTNDQRLIFYKHFKQANEGDDTSTRPGMMDWTGRAKWDARATVKGQSKEDSWSNYVREFIKVVGSSGDANAADWVKKIEQLG